MKMKKNGFAYPKFGKYQSIGSIEIYLSFMFRTIPVSENVGMILFQWNNQPSSDKQQIIMKK